MVANLLRIIRLLVYGLLLEKGSEELAGIIHEAKRIFQDTMPSESTADFDNVIAGSSSTARRPRRQRTEQLCFDCGFELADCACQDDAWDPLIDCD